MVQRLPEIFPILRVLADRPGTPARFLLTGSASPDLLRQVSESLAGRVVYLEIGGLDLGEIDSDIHRRWLRGGYPRAWLAPTDAAASRWLDALIRAQVERDLPAMGMRLPSPMIRRFWTMVGHSSGQTWNGAEMARALAIPEGAVRHHLAMLCGTFLVRRLRPWFTHLGKREVRSPRSTSPTAACSTASSGSATRRTCSPTPRSARRGRASSWSRSWRGSGSLGANAGSGVCTPALSLTCSSPTAAAGSGSSSSARPPPQ